MLEDPDSDSGSEETPAAKSWDFPKMHSLLHLFDDIVAKGATRNYNTKTNESRHRPLKRTYQLLTNFKDVAEQVRFPLLQVGVITHSLNRSFVLIIGNILSHGFVR